MKSECINNTILNTHKDFIDDISDLRLQLKDYDKLNGNQAKIILANTSQNVERVKLINRKINTKMKLRKHKL